VGGEERLVIMAEVERHYLPKRDQPPNAVALAQRNAVERIKSVEGVAQAIRRAVAEAHELRIYSVLLLKPGSIPKTSSGKIQRHACRANFLTGNLDAIKE
jgi:acyl-CoA synthetase (AMP-forming)/AMP-acid ligase II